MSPQAKSAYLRMHQYGDASNLNARIALHTRFSTNRYGWHRWVYDHLLDALGPEACILEVGCGPADLWRRNEARIPPNWRITLSDYSPGMIAEARRSLQQSNLERFRFVEA